VLVKRFNNYINKCSFYQFFHQNNVRSLSSVG
jgi:hypothetical protein